MSTNTNEVTNRANQLWGIYHTNREYARLIGDPLRTVVEAATKQEAEQIADRLGFGAPWAHLVTPDQAKQAQWLPLRISRHLHRRLHRTTRGIHV